MKKRILLIALAIMMVATVFALPMARAEESAKLDPYTFSLYYSYDWWDINPWGEDATSKYWADKFSLSIEQSKPDADAAAKLNLMVSSDELPDVIQMDRGPDHMRLAQLGIFVDLAPLQARNPLFDQNILASTQDLLKIDGKLYSIPHWARKGPTGGNNVWMYEKRLYEQAGSPDLSTFEGLYAYAKKVKDTIPTNAEGLPVIPFASGNNNDAFDIITSAFYRSMGGPNKAVSYTARIDGKLQFVMRDPIFRKAVMETNKWYREGLISETQFSDTNEQMIEKFTTGRTALLYYDHSQDSINRFRKIMIENEPGNDYVRVIDPVYPPSAGVTKTYADEKGSIGWNVHGITRDAKEPQRIFDFLSYMLTKEGSIDMMYGPPGVLYDELDADGNPILRKPMSQLTAEENDKVGTWIWSFCNHSDNVDITKFAVNKMQPAEFQDWVEQTQSDFLTPIMFVTDEYANIALTIDKLSDLGIARTRCVEEYQAQMPKILMAKTAEEAEALYDALLKFFEDNGLADIEAAYDAKYQENVALQGFSSYADYGK